MLRGVSRLAFGTLPPEIRRLYGVEVGPVRRQAMRATFAATRLVRPLLPHRYRFIAPYTDHMLRRRGIDPGSDLAEARKRAGIRL